MQQSFREHSTVPVGLSPPIRVLIQGERGAFHHLAARELFGSQPLEIIPQDTFGRLVHSLEGDPSIDYALMAIENTLGGSLMHNFNLLESSTLQICGEVYLQISQHLMALPGTRICQLREVRSHPMAIAQCRAFFADKPHIRLVEAEDTAKSARQIRDEQLEGVGAIASALAAEIYHLDVLAARIETHHENHTRFLLLSRADRNPAVLQSDKVSLCFTTSHSVGSLHQVLAVLAAYRANLTKIESAPIIGRPFEYRFFVDLLPDPEIGIEALLEAIRPITHQLKLMGIYPRGHFEI